jgi:murein DD-endopeptidase MepM/ murein hydrolase activator NlpD
LVLIRKVFRKIKKILLAFLLIIVIGLLLPQSFSMPVENATNKDFNHKSYWAYPWGKSVTHKGVDIFANKGTNIRSSTKGIVLLKGHRGAGGKYVVILGAKWRLHYYAHMNEIKTSALSFVGHNTIIGTVGNTGNAKNTPSHLHYSILTPIPYPWRADDGIQGWMKMFILNPVEYLNDGK